MKTRLIGDIHGDWNGYSEIAENAVDFGGCDHTIQIGDFGIGFAGSYWHDRVNDFQYDGTHRFIRGNHDNPAKCKEMLGWIKDGLVEDDVMYIGGAWSIDQAYRTEGVSWWRDEELSISELYEMIDIYEKIKPRIMITHDCSFDVATEMFFRSGILPSGERHTTRTASALNTMMEIHQPEFHFFGHWHHSIKRDYKNTTYVCLGINDYVDVDLANSNQIHEALEGWGE